MILVKYLTKYSEQLYFQILTTTLKLKNFDNNRVKIIKLINKL